MFRPLVRLFDLKLCNLHTLRKYVYVLLEINLFECILCVYETILIQMYHRLQGWLQCENVVVGQEC
jgi:hypothetical protein